MCSMQPLEYLRFVRMAKSTRKRDCCVCNCLIHPYHSDCGTCGCELYEDEDLNVEAVR